MRVNKKILKKSFSTLILTVLCFIISFGFNISMAAASSSVNKLVEITFATPGGWQKENAEIKIDTKAENCSITKVEGKIDANGAWKDITNEPILIINKNCTVYVQVTYLDNENREKIVNGSKYIECLDNEKPTVKANFDNGTLNITATDNLSQVAKILINEEEHSNIENGTLHITLDAEYKKFKTLNIKAVDNAGNISSPVEIENRFFVEDVPKVTPQKSEEIMATTQVASAPMATEKPKNDVKTAPVEKPKSEVKSIPVEQPEDVVKALPIATIEGDGSLSTTNSIIEPESETIPDSNNTVITDGAAATPNGGATTIESVSKKNSEREFHTIETENGTVFYLIIDSEKAQGNVYFLKQVDEYDLSKMADKADEKQKNGTTDNVDDSAIPTKSDDIMSKIPSANELGQGINQIGTDQAGADTSDVDRAGENEKNIPVKKSSNGFMIFLIIVGAASLGAYYYLKIYRKKDKDFDDVEDFEEIEFVNDDAVGEYSYSPSDDENVYLIDEGDEDPDDEVVEVDPDEEVYVEDINK